MHTQKFRIVRRVGSLTAVLALAVAGVGGATALSAGTAAAASPHATITTVATGLNSPRHLTVGPDGALYVAEAGTGGPAFGAPGADCVATTNEANVATHDCFGTTGVIARVTTGGTVTPVLSGLPSVVTEAAGPLPAEYAGPSDVAYVNGHLDVTTQDDVLNANGTNQFASAEATDLGSLVTGSPNSAASSWTQTANLAAYAAAHPQGSSSLGTEAGESATDSDPYAVTPYNGGFAVADAAANDLLWVSPTGVISQLATFPATALGAEAVPTSVAVGPDGALYVGELVGAVAGTAGTAVVYRVVPGQQPTVYASGFSAITDVAFGRDGLLLVLEYNTQGLLGAPGTSGAVIQVAANGTQTTLASTGLTGPTGMAVGTDGSIYVSNNGDVAGAGSIVKILMSPDGYQEVASDGGAFALGSYRFLGSLGGVHLVQPIVAGASTRLAPGYWSVAADGGVFAFGADAFYGSLGGVALVAPIVGMAPTPDGRGYWLVAKDGGVFAFGDAKFYGSEGGKPLNAPIVGIAATPDGAGYWLVGSDGGIFTFGDAKFYGSEGGTALTKPVVGIAATPDGAGYWEVASDGGIFTFGDAKYKGSEGGIVLAKPVVGIEPTPDGAGYWEVASDGGIFTFGDATFFGSEGGAPLVSPVVGFG
jgi:hypothetical protein